MCSIFNNKNNIFKTSRENNLESLKSNDETNIPADLWKKLAIYYLARLKGLCDWPPKPLPKTFSINSNRASVICSVDNLQKKIIENVITDDVGDEKINFPTHPDFHLEDVAQYIAAGYKDGKEQAAHIVLRSLKYGLLSGLLLKRGNKFMINPKYVKSEQCKTRHNPRNRKLSKKRKNKRNRQNFKNKPSSTKCYRSYGNSHNSNSNLFLSKGKKNAYNIRYKFEADKSQLKRKHDLTVSDSEFEEQPIKKRKHPNRDEDANPTCFSSTASLIKRQKSSSESYLGCRHIKPAKPRRPTHQDKIQKTWQRKRKLPLQLRTSSSESNSYLQYSRANIMSFRNKSICVICRRKILY